MKIENLPVSKIYPRSSAGNRAINEGKVAQLANSIQEVGLRHPISVTAAQRLISGVLSDVWEIIAGHHRYAAVLSLGEETIPAEVLTLDALRLELTTIDENLMRSGLSPAEEAWQVARRKVIYEELHPETRSTSDGGPGRAKQTRRQNGDDTVDRFTTATAKAAGKSERNVQRAALRGKKLGEEALGKIKGTSLDKGNELDALVALPKERREELVERAAAGENVTATRKKVTSDFPNAVDGVLAKSPSIVPTSGDNQPAEPEGEKLDISDIADAEGDGDISSLAAFRMSIRQSLGFAMSKIDPAERNNLIDAMLLEVEEAKTIIGWKPGTPPTTGNEAYVTSLVPEPEGNQISVAWLDAPPSERAGFIRECWVSLVRMAPRLAGPIKRAGEPIRPNSLRI